MSKTFEYKVILEVPDDVPNEHKTDIGASIRNSVYRDEHFPFDKGWRIQNIMPTK